MASTLHGPSRYRGILLAWLLIVSGHAQADASAQSKPQQARATAAEQLAAAEREHGPDAPEVLLPLVALAAATVQAGDVPAAEALLARADGLLDRHPNHDRSLRLAVLVLDSECLARQGKVAESNQVLYDALDLARKTSTIGPLEQANVLDRLAANEGRRGLVTRANNYTSDALELRGKHHGKDSIGYANALLNAADWYRFSAQFKRERDLDHEALAILERKLGPEDPFLAVPLIRIATSYTAQHLRAAEAENALQRALGLKFSDGRDDVLTRAEALASLGDLRVVFGKPEDATAYYVSAWQAIAASPKLGASAANAYFGKVRQIYVEDLETIAYEGTVKLQFAITALGTTDEVKIIGDDLTFTDSQSLSGKSRVLQSAWRSVQQSRYRPRLVDGAAVATAGQTTSLEYCVDALRAQSRCSGKGLASVVP